MVQSSKLGNLFAAAGAIAGAYVAIKGNKGNTAFFLYALGFAAGGYLIGNSITKFYE